MQNKNNIPAGEGLWLDSLSLENFKNLVKHIIEIGGESLMIIGRNGAGKSSLIQAIMSPLDTKEIPTEPIKNGEDRSRIQVTLAGQIGGQPKKYFLDLHFTPGKKSGRLVVTNENGETIPNAKSFVKGLIGNVSFDPTKWLNETPAAKLKMLKQVTKCEQQIDEVISQVVEKKATYKAKKERAEELESVLKNHGYTQDQVNLYSTPIDIAPIEHELSTVGTNMETYQYVENGINTAKTNMANADLAIIAANKEIERLNGLIAEQRVKIKEETDKHTKAKENAEKGQMWMNGVEKPNVEVITKKLTDANAHNQHHEVLKNHEKQSLEVLKTKQDMDTVQTEIEGLQKRVSDIIAKSQLQIKGLSFSEDQIFIDGLPLDRGQINTARLIDIGIDVAMALNPTLKVMFLHDASLFDKQSLHNIIKKIEKRGYQVIAEVVTDTDLDVKFVEHEA
jgi:hypothetical protein